MENPYQPPLDAASLGLSTGQLPEPQGWAQQIRIVAVLMMIHGAIVVLYGIGMVCAALWIPEMLVKNPQFINPNVNPGQAQFEPQTMLKILRITYIVMSLAAFSYGLLNILAGWQNFQYRNKTLGLVALIGGVATFLTCYCMPTAMLLMIYGLIVYLSKDATVMFESRQV